jgi:hypothetical protein
MKLLDCVQLWLPFLTTRGLSCGSGLIITEREWSPRRSSKPTAGEAGGS